MESQAYYQCSYCAGTNAIALDINIYWDYDAQQWLPSEIDSRQIECMDCGNHMEYCEKTEESN